MERLPAEDVDACLRDTELQRRRSAEASALDRENMSWVREHALRDGAPEDAEWIWFTAPEHAWGSEAGTEGWLLYHRESRTQHGYIETTMS